MVCFLLVYFCFSSCLIGSTSTTQRPVSRCYDSASVGLGFAQSYLKTQGLAYSRKGERRERITLYLVCEALTLLKFSNITSVRIRCLQLNHSYISLARTEYFVTVLSSVNGRILSCLISYSESSEFSVESHSLMRTQIALHDKKRGTHRLRLPVDSPARQRVVHLKPCADHSTMS